jgi:hypothetical protein
VMSERTLVGGGGALDISIPTSEAMYKHITYTCWMIGGLPCSVKPGTSREMPVNPLSSRTSNEWRSISYHGMVESQFQLLSW